MNDLTRAQQKHLITMKRIQSTEGEGSEWEVGAVAQKTLKILASLGYISFRRDFGSRIKYLVIVNL